MTEIGSQLARPSNDDTPWTSRNVPRARFCHDDSDPGGNVRFRRTRTSRSGQKPRTAVSQAAPCPWLTSCGAPAAPVTPISNVGENSASKRTGRRNRNWPPLLTSRVVRPAGGALGATAETGAPKRAECRPLVAPCQRRHTELFAERRQPPPHEEEAAQHQQAESSLAYQLASLSLVMSHPSEEAIARCSPFRGRTRRHSRNIAAKNIRGAEMVETSSATRTGSASQASTKTTPASTQAQPRIAGTAATRQSSRSMEAPAAPSAPGFQ